MSRPKTSHEWMREHVTDHYVQQAKALGYRSRAAFKLIEMDDKAKWLKPGQVVVDLGAAPGGWSQVAAHRLQGRGRVIAVDLLEMNGLADVEFIQGDFTEKAVLREVVTCLGPDRPGLVLSDMSPNLSGISGIDQPKSAYLAELALDFALEFLQPRGHFLVKAFQGSDFNSFRLIMTKSFERVVSLKPAASRGRSAEMYLWGCGRIISR